MLIYCFPFVKSCRYETYHWDGGIALDVMARRSSYIKAIVSGQAVVKDYPDGGHTVTLYGNDNCIYYHAHLIPGTGVAGTVKSGDPIGRVGNSGNAADRPSHCHFAIASKNHDIDTNGSGNIPPYHILKLLKMVPQTSLLFPFIILAVRARLLIPRFFIKPKNPLA